jgi:hypothetical protein
MLQTKVVETSKDILLSINFSFRKSCRLWDMWKNNAEPDRPQMTIWRRCSAYWIIKATHTHTHTHNNVILTDSPL